MHEELNLWAVLAIAATLLVWSAAAPRLRRLNITGPMFFVAVGLLLANLHVGVESLDVYQSGIRALAEIALAVVLFGDAAGVRLRALRRDASLPIRLLGVGLPVTMAVGTVTAKLFFPGLSWWLCALIGAAVAPTDAALGAAIIEDDRVPERVRRVLNVESGLNDGIATPFVTFFLAAAVSAVTTNGSSHGEAIADLAVGVLCGAAIGVIGGWLLARSGAASDSASRNLGAASIALVAYAAVVEMGANGFVAAFVAGLAYGWVERHSNELAVEKTLGLTHQGGELLSFTVWFLFGAVMVPELANAEWRDLVFALLALSVIRMLPVWLALLGVGFDHATVAVIGWFGPRGLASVVFALLAVGDLSPAEGSRVLVVITTTVLASVVLHGVSAAPIAQRYASRRS